MSETYDVLTLPVHIGSIINEQNRIKPFVGVYFPVEILTKMNWDKNTRLILSVEKDCLKISKSDAHTTEYWTNELIYVPDEE